ncbi:MAG: hypothetical protein WC734_02685 [Patescibacteria group bacterium]|jgi:hypothetical protein
MSKIRLLGMAIGLLVVSLFVAGIGVMAKPKPAEATWGRLKYCYEQCGNNSDCIARCMGKTQNASQEGGGSDW